MKKEELPSFIGTISGKLSKKSNKVYCTKNNITYSYNLNRVPKEPSAKQKEQQNRFKKTRAKVFHELKDPEKNAHWQKIARQSKGKCKNAYALAFKALYSSI